MPPSLIYTVAKSIRESPELCKSPSIFTQYKYWVQYKKIAQISIIPFNLDREYLRFRAVR